MMGWLLCRLSFHKPVLSEDRYARRADIECARPGCNWPYL